MQVIITVLHECRPGARNGRIARPSPFTAARTVLVCAPDHQGVGHAGIDAGLEDARVAHPGPCCEISCQPRDHLAVHRGADRAFELGRGPHPRGQADPGADAAGRQARRHDRVHGLEYDPASRGLVRRPRRRRRPALAEPAAFGRAADLSSSTMPRTSGSWSITTLSRCWSVWPATCRRSRATSS